MKIYWESQIKNQTDIYGRFFWNPRCLLQAKTWQFSCKSSINICLGKNFVSSIRCLSWENICFVSIFTPATWVSKSTHGLRLLKKAPRNLLNSSWCMYFEIRKLPWFLSASPVALTTTTRSCGMTTDQTGCTTTSLLGISSTVCTSTCTTGKFPTSAYSMFRINAGGQHLAASKWLTL